MSQQRQRVVLFGATGTMGLETLKELWKRRSRYDLVLLSRPSEKNRRILAPYIKAAKIPADVRKGRAIGDGLYEKLATGSHRCPSGMMRRADPRRVTPSRREPTESDRLDEELFGRPELQLRKLFDQYRGDLQELYFTLPVLVGPEDLKILDAGTVDQSSR